MTRAAPASVEFRGVTKRYGAAAAVDDVSFAIAPGTLVTLLGPSGCGKTTTLRLIAGLEIASAGRVTIGGRDVTNLSAAERDVSMVFQSYALFPHMSVLDNAAYGPTVQGAGRRRAREMAAAKLAAVGLAGYEARLPSELSGGQQQRVAVARALVLEPQVLLFDEPLSNLDAKLRRRVRDDIRELQQELRLTVAYVTHDQEEALAVSDRIIVMRGGRIAQSGSPRALYEEPADRFVADFIGDANLIEAQVTELRGERALARLQGLDLELPRRGVGLGPVTLAVRPEAVRIETDRPDGAALPARVRKSAYLGRHVEYVLTTAAGDLFVVDRARHEALAPQTEVWLTLTGRDVAIVPGLRGAPTRRRASRAGRAARRQAGDRRSPR